ncbi:MAG: ATP-dependent Clp protease proteolytic subunit [Armatimonadetes bacterium]|nr:ATP-dependent Clp protease proteolytic subunit [Armatimonadota bacterium]
MGFLSQLIFFLFIASAFLPMVQQRMLEASRIRFMQNLERKRKSRIIALIHRQESMSLLGIPIVRYINIEDSEEVLRAIRMTPDDMPIDIILHTPGGLVLASEQIACALQRHKAKVTVFVPHYAMSGGTLIALASDEICMDPNAVLGPVDPQIGEYPAASILKAVRQKDRNEIDDSTWIRADIAEKAQRQVKELVRRILSDKLSGEALAELSEALTDGRWTHDYPIDAEEVKAMGLPVCEEVPEEVYMLMSLYPQPAQRRPTVTYIPVPYRKEDVPPVGKPGGGP